MLNRRLLPLRRCSGQACFVFRYSDAELTLISITENNGGPRPTLRFWLSAIEGTDTTTAQGLEQMTWRTAAVEAAGRFVVSSQGIFGRLVPSRLLWVTRGY